MDSQRALRISLFLLRFSVFLVMFVWTIDKFVRPGHASMIFEHFYRVTLLDKNIMWGLALVELIIILCFLFGVMKSLSYGLVLLFHFASTAASYKQFMAPYHGSNLLFFASLPMLAACVALFLLRDKDTFISFG